MQHEYENCEGLKKLEGKIDQILAAQRAFAGAFAKGQDGDADFMGHRLYHEAVISAAKAQADFWRGLRYDITRKGVWFLLVTIFGLAAVGLAFKFWGFAVKLGLAVPAK